MEDFKRRDSIPNAKICYLKQQFLNSLQTAIRENFGVTETIKPQRNTDEIATGITMQKLDERVVESDKIILFAIQQKGNDNVLFFKQFLYYADSDRRNVINTFCVDITTKINKPLSSYCLDCTGKIVSKETVVTQPHTEIQEYWAGEPTEEHFLTYFGGPCFTVPKGGWQEKTVDVPYSERVVYHQVEN